ncbi:hypothetical protein WDW37_11950 [Bdellovibrionota bacterium FG-1]
MRNDSLCPHSSGQTLVEFSACLLLTIPLITGAIGFIRQQWIRTQCAVRAFEATHAALIGKPVKEPGFTFQNTATSLRGQAQCGGITQIVELPYLEGGT